VSQRRSYSVIVAEDEPLIRQNLSKKLAECCPEFEVVCEAADGREAIEAISEFFPDVLVTDIRMPVLDGIALIREVYYAFPEVKVLIISGYDDFGYAKAALEFGVKDYLLKPIEIAELRKTMTRLAVQLESEQKKFESEHPDFVASIAHDEIAGLVKEYLRNHFSQEISLNELALRFHVNQPYLARLFKRCEGLAPVRYLHDLRIAHARRLLSEHPTMEIKQVGSLCGYPDQGYFSRIFKREVGVSPTEYRERLK
jgi:two-component system, response regulator YesN